MTTETKIRSFIGKIIMKSHFVTFSHLSIADTLGFYFKKSNDSSAVSYFAGQSDFNRGRVKCHSETSSCIEIGYFYLGDVREELVS